MPAKKGKKGKKDEDWGDDGAVEERMKKLMVAVPMVVQLQ